MKNIISIILIIPIKVYQKVISPMFPPKCIYYPSCSTYCVDSLKTHGPIKGLIFGILRIFRCSPFFKGGVDLVDKNTTFKGEISKYKHYFRSKEK